MPKMNARVIAERVNEYKSPAKGWVSERLVTLIDLEPTKGATFRDTIEYKLTEEEERKYPADSLLQKNVVFGLSKVSLFGRAGGQQRLSFEGVILEVLKGA